MRGAMLAGVGYTAYKAGQHGEQDRSHEYDQEERLQQLEQQQYQQPQQQYAPPPPVQAAPAGLSMDEKTDQLTKLKGLLDAGVLTQDEFDQQKMKILAS
jgi:hypothetical protein